MGGWYKHIIIKVLHGLKRQGFLFGSASAALLLVCGCASTVQYPPFPDQSKRVEDPTKARIYVIRPAKMWQGGVPLVVYGTDLAAQGPIVDPSQKIIVPVLGILPDNYSRSAHMRRIGEVGPGSYICWETPPHVFNIEKVEGDPDSICSLDLNAGDVYYFRAWLRPGWIKDKTILRTVSEAEGQALLKHCKPPPLYTNQNLH